MSSTMRVSCQRMCSRRPPSAARAARRARPGTPSTGSRRTTSCGMPGDGFDIGNVVCRPRQDHGRDGTRGGRVPAHPPVRHAAKQRREFHPKALRLRQTREELAQHAALRVVDERLRMDIAGRRRPGACASYRAPRECAPACDRQAGSERTCPNRGCPPPACRCRRRAAAPAGDRRC